MRACNRRASTTRCSAARLIYISDLTSWKRDNKEWSYYVFCCRPTVCVPEERVGKINAGDMSNMPGYRPRQRTVAAGDQDEQAFGETHRLPPYARPTSRRASALRPLRAHYGFTHLTRSPCRLDTPCPKFSHRRQIGPQQQWMLERKMIERRFDFQAFQLAVSDPVLLDVAQSEKAQFFGGLIIGEMAAVFDDFAQLHMQAFNRVGRVNHFPNFRRISRKESPAPIAAATSV